jgi:hypothetical protein
VLAEKIEEGELGAVRVPEAIIFFDDGTGRQRTALFGEPRHMAAKFDFLRHQRLARFAVFRALAGKWRLGVFGERYGRFQSLGIHDVAPLIRVIWITRAGRTVSRPEMRKDAAPRQRRIRNTPPISSATPSIFGKSIGRS